MSEKLGSNLSSEETENIPQRGRSTAQEAYQAPQSEFCYLLIAFLACYSEFLSGYHENMESSTN